MEKNTFYNSLECNPISLFCSDLDKNIYLFETEDITGNDSLQERLYLLQNILEENVDAGVEPHEAFAYIQNFLVHDIERFLFDYILAHIEGGSNSYARDLIEGYYPYVEEKVWFDYLETRVCIAEELEEGFEKLEDLVEIVKEEPNLDLQLEILAFLSLTGHHSLFTKLATLTLFQLEVEEDFLEFTTICLNHFRYLELESLAQQIELLQTNRPQRELDQPFSTEDPDLLNLHRIFAQKTLLC